MQMTPAFPQRNAVPLAYRREPKILQDRKEITVQRVAVLFADIANFTLIAERMDPLDTFLMLERYLGHLREIAEREGGYVEVIGDGLMALFGLENDRDTSVQAVNAGLKLLKACRAQSRSLPRRFWELPLRLRIGVHSGTTAVGYVVSGQGPRKTAIGHTINVAKRVEMANKALGTRFLISDQVYSEIPPIVLASRFDAVSLHGVSRPVTLYEVHEPVDP